MICKHCLMMKKRKRKYPITVQQSFYIPRKEQRIHNAESNCYIFQIKCRLTHEAVN